MSFDLKQDTWRIWVWRGGLEPYWFWITGSHRVALKEAVAAFRSCRGPNERQRGSLYRDSKATWVHPAFGAGAEVRIEKWN